MMDGSVGVRPSKRLIRVEDPAQGSCRFGAPLTRAIKRNTADTKTIEEEPAKGYVNLNPHPKSPGLSVYVDL